MNSESCLGGSPFFISLNLHRKGCLGSLRTPYATPQNLHFQCEGADYDRLKVRIDQTLHSRDLHAHASYILSAPDFFDHVEPAWAVWMLSKMSFASMLDGTFGYDFKGGMPKKLRNAKDDFSEALAERLENATIESRHAFEVIETYDSIETFHFVDPPYVGRDHCTISHTVVSVPSSRVCLT